MRSWSISPGWLCVPIPTGSMREVGGWRRSSLYRWMASPNLMTSSFSLLLPTCPGECVLLRGLCVCGWWCLWQGMWQGGWVCDRECDKVDIFLTGSVTVQMCLWQGIWQDKCVYDRQCDRVDGFVTESVTRWMCLWQGVWQTGCVCNSADVFVAGVWQNGCVSDRECDKMVVFVPGWMCLWQGVWQGGCVCDRVDVFVTESVTKWMCLWQGGCVCDRELDHAMLRRLEKRILVDLPSLDARCAMFKHHLPPTVNTAMQNGLQLYSCIDYEYVAKVWEIIL